ncbi:hypothetical protein ACQ0P8_16195 (plasmid) [Halodesulfovibrio aestuarii]|uniref:Uncharacterized protein n=1 Tax=Halodesulfovibrio aestuarii TaxID=126333 RepID=A0A8G2FC98_9BACT|nr:hypothetical protein [Halodesulfovibrio aestuarii]SHJ72759.1 hypothetical protein SAMN05660830_03099 [Halodesulfovibrio aestuarii]
MNKLDRKLWTPVELEIPPINQISRVLLEHYNDDERLDMTTEHLAIGKDDKSVLMTTNKHERKHRLHKVTAWQPINLLDKTTMLEVTEFLTEIAKEEK